MSKPVCTQGTLPPSFLHRSFRWLVLFALFVGLSPALHAAKVLFVTAGARRDSVKISNILQAQGHEVTVFDATTPNADTAAAYAAQGYQLLVVDEVISSGRVGDRFRNSPIPVINWEGFLYSNGRSLFNAGASLTGGTYTDAAAATAANPDYGQVQATTAIEIVDPNHPLAAGLPAGPVNVFDPNAPPPTATPADGSGVISFAGARTFITNVQVAATVPGFANGYCVWGVDVGALNTDGTTNQARWVHLPWNDSDEARVMIEPSFFIFEAAVAWALHLPEPTKIYNFTGGNVDGTNSLSFSVDKTTHSGSPVVQTNIHLKVDGVDVSSALTIVANGDKWDVSYAGLVANKDYTAVATATAGDGGFSARLLAFNTFVQITFNPNFYTIEAEDYNYGGGLFFDNVVVCNGPLGGGTPGCYFGRIGFTNIDEHEIDFAPGVVLPTTATEVYRFGGTVANPTRYDWVDTYITGDSLVRAQYTTAGVSEYEVRGITTGEWLNYTRTVPKTNYNIYARLSSTNALHVHMDFVTSGATTVNQTLQSVGEFIKPSGTGGAFELIPLTDDTGTNLIVVPFDGSTKTMRFTALSDGYRENFFMFVPVAQAILPTVAITNPAAGAILQEGVQVTVEANAQDTDGSVSKVEFFAGTSEPLTSIGVDTNAPYSATFTPPVLGVFKTYTLRAVATDNANNTNQTSVQVTVQPPSSLAPAGKLAKIVWVTFHSADATPTTDAVTAGFTNAPDKAYTDLLAANGYDVTRYVSTITPDPAVLNAADLVIIGRSIDSAHYGSAGATAWNNITAPTIIMSGYALRSSRMGYTSGGTMVDITNNITLTVSNPAHPIFAGISLTSGTMDNPFAGLVNYPPGVTSASSPRGISINTDPVNASGTVLATISAAGGGPAGSLVIGEWQAGATLTHDPSGTQDTLAGHRLVFLSGTREASGVTSQSAGIYDLTADGARMFLNAVAYMLHPQPYKVTWVTFHSADGTPATDAVTAGFTNAPDKAYTDLLTANGYNVTRYVSTLNPDPAVLNAADVVIIGRSIDSANYGSAGATAWNSITAPILNMSGYTLRSSRMGYTTGGTMVDITNNITLTVSNPTHYIFHGISLTGGTMNNPFAGLVNYPPGVTSANAPRGISINTDPANVGGTVLATISAAGGGPVGGMVIGEWQPGSIMTHDPSSTQDTLAGPRVVFLSGSREASGVTSQSAGIYDLSADGAQMFLNAVRYTASRKGGALAPNTPPAFQSIVRNLNGTATLTWTGGGTLQSAPSVTGQWTNVVGATSPYTTPAAVTGDGFFRVSVP